MAELSDVVNSIKELNNTVRESADGTATQQAKEAEAQNERKTYDNEVLNTLKSIQSIMGQNFKGLNQGDKKGGGLIAGLLGGIGNAVGGVFKAVSKIGMGFVKGMAALGGGIGAFMLALGGTSMILGLMGADGTELKTVIENFFGAFSPETAIAMGGLVLLASTMSKAKISAGSFVKNMGALGAGIGAFFIAIGAADWLTDAAGLSGESLATGISSFFTAFSKEAVGLMTGMVLLATTMATFKTDKTQFVKAMAALGAGIGAFFIAIGAADWLTKAAGLSGESLATLMTNFFGAFTKESVALMTGMALLATTAATIPGTDPIKMAAGMTALGAGFAGFFLGILAADGFAKIGDTLGLTGASLKPLMKNFVDAFTDAGKTGVAVLVAIMSVGTLASIGKADPITIFGSMTAMGAGLAGFFGGILLADWLANVAGAEGIKGESLKTLMKN